jgi:hypothetical protein
MKQFDTVAHDRWLNDIPEDKSQDEIDAYELYLEDQEQARQDDLRNMA